MWTVALTVTGLAGLYVLAKHWWGWLIYLANEALWLGYGASKRLTPVVVMAVLWGLLGVRNLYVARNAHMSAVREEVPAEPRTGRDAARYLHHVLLWYCDPSFRAYQREVGSWYAHRAS